MRPSKDTDVAYNGRVWVRGAVCEHCLLTKDRLVDGERAREIIQGTREQEGSAFICHRGQTGEDAQTSICRGWWDNFHHEDEMFKLVEALGVVEFTEVED